MKILTSDDVMERNWPPPSRALPANRQAIIAHHGVRRASELTVMVRDESRETIAEYLDDLDRGKLYAVIVALAAMVPDDVPVDELLEWTEPLIGGDAELELGLDVELQLEVAS